LSRLRLIGYIYYINLKQLIMTTKQSNIFRQIVDTNCEVKKLMEAGKWRDALAKSAEHMEHVKKLKKSMGETEYRRWMDMGSRMFAPVREDDN
jgi:hypothetical protein